MVIEDRIKKALLKLKKIPQKAHKKRFIKMIMKRLRGKDGDKDEG